MHRGGALPTIKGSQLCDPHLAGASGSEKQSELFLKDVFDEANVLLLMAPPSASEPGDVLAPVLRPNPLTRQCPGYGKAISMRKVVKGKNSVKSFRVCREFFSYRGIARIDRI